MTESSGAVHGLLHDANEELSVAVLELELLLERGDLDVAAQCSLASCLEACRRAAQHVRQVSSEFRQSGERR